MHDPRARIAAAVLLALATLLPIEAQGAAYAPKGERLEILRDWEKAKGARPPPEIVAGIYERDYQRYDFRNKVAITIDDCAPNDSMAAELDALKRYKVKAVFFIIGSYFVGGTGKPMPRAKELLGRVVSEGHQIGSHGYYHRRLDEGGYRDDPAALRRELELNEALVDRILGYHYAIRYFRPPNGAHSTPLYALDRLLLERGQYLANWTITAFDWNIRYKPGNPERLVPGQVVARTVKQAREESGGVVLFHGFPTSAAILDQLLAALGEASNDKGPIRFSTLDELMRLKYAGGEKTQP